MPPLITNPTWIFLVTLLIILLAPIVFRRLRVPHIIGLILAGVVVGEHGLNLLARDASFELFGQVGIYYIMFLAGLEMDMGSFRRYGSRGVAFGVLTFLLPFVVGLVVATKVLGFGLASALVVSSLLASHTLVTYPIVARYGLGKLTQLRETEQNLILEKADGIHQNDTEEEKKNAKHAKVLIEKSRNLDSVALSSDKILYPVEYTIRANMLIEARRLVGGVVLERN